MQTDKAFVKQFVSMKARRSGRAFGSGMGCHVEVNDVRSMEGQDSEDI